MTNIWPLQSECLSFYGDPRTPSWLHGNTIDVPCPWPLHMGNVAISHILIHKKCAQSLVRVLNNIWEATGRSFDTIKKLRYDVYDGSYNLRNIRGSSPRHCPCTHLPRRSIGTRPTISNTRSGTSSTTTACWS